MSQQPLILTLKMDEESQAFFNEQRQRYFPPERNLLEAHLMLFHQLPNKPESYEFFHHLKYSPFTLTVTGLMNLGAGAAFRIESHELNALRQSISLHFSDMLIPQDRQGFRPHITIMNKTTPGQARNLITQLSVNFKSFQVKAVGLELWTYLDGPWRHEHIFLFRNDC